jgi:DNA-binding IclR family transcriptional regulator
VKIPAEAVIPDEKITRYLLAQRARNDKSKFLAQAGFTTDDPEALRAAIQSIAEAGEAVEDRSNEYGVFHQVIGELVGVNGVTLSVVTIWLQRQIDGKFQFITLKPLKKT